MWFLAVFPVMFVVVALGIYAMVVTEGKAEVSS